MVRCRPVLARVRSSADDICRTIASLKRSRSPMKRTRTPRRSSSSTSRSSAPRNSFISAPTSSSGRPQFSLEKANRVSASMPCSRQKSMQTLTARAPARWPMTRGRRRRSAQRPLPSMMTARWRGTRAAAMAGSEDMAGRVDPSNRHKFLLFGLDHLIDVLDGGVGDLLDLDLGAADVVFGDLLFLQQFLDLVVGIAADVADGDLGVLALGVDELGQFLAALLGEGGQVEADHGAGGVRGQAEVGGEDRLLDGADHLLFPRRDDQRTRVGDLDG